MYKLCLDMSKQLNGQKEQGKIIVRMNGSVIGISETNYTISCQSGTGNQIEIERQRRYEDIIRQQISSSYESS